MHWFSGTKAQLDRAVAMGCWFSVGPSMTRSRKDAALLAAMPRDRVLTETDGPFARSRGRPLVPGEVSDAVEVCAEAWRLPAAGAQAVLDADLRSLSAGAQP